MGAKSSKESETATTDGMVCTECKTAISAGAEYTFVDEHKFHSRCFVCVKCGSGLAGSEFVRAGGSLYCLKDYRQYVADKCEGCGQAIEEGKTFTTQGHIFHERCFVCEECGSQLSESEPFFPELRSIEPPESEPVVESDAVTSSSASSSSSSSSSSDPSPLVPQKRKVSGKAEATDEKEHKSRVLLHCKRCNFKDTKENAPCARCDEIIEGEGIFALGKRFHQECFTCLDCQKPLIEKGEFFEVDDRLYCRDPQCVFMRQQRESANNKKRKLDLLGILSQPLSALRQARAEEHQEDEAPSSTEVADAEESEEHLVADTEL